MIKRSNNFFYIENSLSHQNRFENHAFKHVNKKFKLQKFNYYDFSYASSLIVSESCLNDTINEDQN